VRSSPSIVKEHAVSQDSSNSFRFLKKSESGGSILGDVPAWGISLGVHLIALFLLSTLTYVTGGLMEDSLITSVLDEEFDEREYQFDATVADMVGNGSDVNTLSASQSAAQIVKSDPQQEMRQQLEEELLVPEAAPSTSVTAPPEGEVASIVETTGTSEKVGGVEGSIDRMTFEIMNSLKERPTLAVWLFDESGSLSLRREEIANRFETVYGQLDSLKAEKAAPLKTAIVGFGKNINFYTPEPTTDVAKCVNLVKGIKDDESGVEMVFTAVGQIVAKWSKKYRSAQEKHNCMVIIVTDERGDDFIDKDGRNVSAFEEKMAYVVKSGFRVFCIGNAAPFGRQKGFVRWTWSDGYSEDIPVDQGPESPQMEVIDLPFWGARGVDAARVSAGLGPYALTRLCAETGGLYLIADDTRGKEFDSFVMKDYQPDYRPVRLYQQDVSRSVTKQALLAAAELTRNAQVAAPQLAFRADSDNAVRTEADAAQRPAAILEQRVNEIISVLEKGEKDRSKLKEPRWRAAYDLAMGRALAMQARIQGYKLLLAQMKVSPKTFEKQGNNTWYLRANGEITTGPAVRKIATRAIEYLTRVVDDHPGTPWAYLAEVELSQQMGWAWEEGQINYAAMGQMNGDSKNNQVLFLEEEDPKTGQKKKVERKRPSL